MIVDAEGLPVSADPAAQDFERSAERMRRRLARAMYAAAPVGTILDERGRPLNAFQNGNGSRP